MQLNLDERILVWPDNSWMYASEYEDNLESWRGDDYSSHDLSKLEDLARIPEPVLEELIETLVSD